MINEVSQYDVWNAVSDEYRHDLMRDWAGALSTSDEYLDEVIRDIKETWFFEAGIELTEAQAQYFHDNLRDMANLYLENA